ncbi:MAG: hypothetical protein UT05_C0001G0102 [Parcubacteria group bacterium GW2011_GWF2_38_76]|nr:MAG: hypothetical protein UT05_C0001G0102 [Parcubacteria group bacterium GW2011_GWF2_38_76]HBM45922.1 hypothetical protein [Patescibacteria group bacterium]
MSLALLLGLPFPPERIPFGTGEHHIPKGICATIYILLYLDNITSQKTNLQDKMDGTKELFKKAISLSTLILLVEVVIYYRNDLTMGLPVPLVEEWLIPLLALTLAISVGWFFFVQTKKNNRTKDQFVEIATHKFRTPISVIEWSADSLETAIDIMQRREEVKKIRNSLEKLREIIDVLVGSTEVEDSIFYHFETTNLRQIIENSLKESIKKKAEEKGLKILMDLPSKMPFVYADTKRIEFVFKTILNNAITYTPKGGEIKISNEEGEDAFTLKIEDTGIGIGHKEIPLVFSNFYRSKEAKLSDTEGMGLSLYVSKKIIEKHGGNIWAESDGKNRGTTFFVRFKTNDFKQIV